MSERRAPRPDELAAAAGDPRLRAALHASDDSGWRCRAACRGVDADVFFPAAGDSLRPALAICGGCRVTAHCLAQALNNAEQQGVFGATAPGERRAMIVVWRQRQAAARTS